MEKSFGLSVFNSHGENLNEREEIEEERRERRSERKRGTEKEIKRKLEKDER
jgi:hypothetical protein